MIAFYSLMVAYRSNDQSHECEFILMDMLRCISNANRRLHMHDTADVLSSSSKTSCVLRYYLTLVAERCSLQLFLLSNHCAPFCTNIRSALQTTSNRSALQTRLPNLICFADKHRLDLRCGQGLREFTSSIHSHGACKLALRSR